MTTPPNAQEPQAITDARFRLRYGEQGGLPAPLSGDDELVAAYDAMKAERDAAVRALEHVRQQAAIWKQEARTQKHTVDEVGAVLGGVPDYGPIVSNVTALAAERNRLAAVVKRVRTFCETEAQIEDRGDWHRIGRIATAAKVLAILHAPHKNVASGQNTPNATETYDAGARG